MAYGIERPVFRSSIPGGELIGLDCLLPGLTQHIVVGSQHWARVDYWTFGAAMSNQPYGAQGGVSVTSKGLKSF